MRNRDHRFALRLMLPVFLFLFACSGRTVSPADDSAAPDLDAVEAADDAFVPAVDVAGKDQSGPGDAMALPDELTDEDATSDVAAVNEIAEDLLLADLAQQDAALSDVAEEDLSATDLVATDLAADEDVMADTSDEDLSGEDVLEDTSDDAVEVEVVEDTSSKDVEPPECLADADCDDGAFCNGGETCQAGACVAGTPVSCDDGNDCTFDICDDSAGCVNTNQPVDCAGAWDGWSDCVAVVGECVGERTRDFLAESEAVCGGAACPSSQTESCYLAEQSPCDDVDICTDSDSCDGEGLCVGAPVVCDDKVACTVDTCAPDKGCTHVPDDSDCGDSTLCTVDYCDVELGCVHAEDDEFCDDGDLCTLDTCDTVFGCVATPVLCDDGVGCTLDACDPDTGGCSFTPVHGDCSDNQYCDAESGCVDLVVEVPYPVIDTNQLGCYSLDACITCPTSGAMYAGQDAQYERTLPAYENNGDGTVTDLNTGLMWQQTPAVMTYPQAVSGAANATTGGYNDWRLPTIKELYSLMDFSGRDPSNCEEEADCALVPFVDTTYFDFAYGNNGDRLIDSQYASSTEYVGTVFDNQPCAFGLNFADGRIKCYPSGATGQSQTYKDFTVMYVRGDTGYGANSFVDQKDGTILDETTGLLWMQDDSGEVGSGPMNWAEALTWCETLTYAGHADWRLPDAKELQSIVDYTRSPETTNSAAIAPVFDATPITDEGDGSNWAFYWTSTTFLQTSPSAEHVDQAVYVGFGECLGFIEVEQGQYVLQVVHGTGCQRADPKEGDPADYPNGNGPQGDVVRIDNMVRCVSGGAVGDLAAGAGCVAVPTSPDCAKAEPGSACCGDDVCDWLESSTNCSGDCGGGQSGDCQLDCAAQGACPPGAALGCGCKATPDGNKCLPLCEQDNDCPDPPDATLVCAPEGVCVPEGGPPQN